MTRIKVTLQLILALVLVLALYVGCGVNESRLQPYSYVTLGGTHPEGGVIVGDYLYIINMGDREVDKVALSSFTLKRTLALSVGAPETIETDGSYLYIGTMKSPGKIVKVRISDFSEVGVLSLDAGVNKVAGMHIIGTDLYAGIWADPAKVVRVDLPSFSVTATVTFNSGESKAEEMDDDGKYIYVPLEGSDQIGRILISDFVIDTVINLPSGVEEPQEALVISNYVYVATRAGAANVGVVRVPISNFHSDSISPMVFQVNEQRACAMANDSDYLYVFSDYESGPKRITKVEINTFTRIGSIVLPNSISTGGPEVLVEKAGYLYACDNNKLYRVQFSDEDNLN